MMQRDLFAAEATSNRPPACRWRSHTIGDHTKRQRFYVDGAETPWFIDTAYVHAHKHQGRRHSLWGSGMSKSGCAACFGSGDLIAPLKHRAEQLGMEWGERQQRAA